MNALGEILIGVIGGIIVIPLTVPVLRAFDFGNRLLQRVFGMPFHIGGVISRGGITRMTLERGDYHKYRTGAGALRSYLATAELSIDIVSISLNVTQAEGSLISLFEEKIHADPTYRVRITLLDPSCVIVPHLARSLDMEPDRLRDEIEDTLEQLVACRSKLNAVDQQRLEIYVHSTLPIGSAILLDASTSKGRIQIETKLYRAPRTESFGFEVTAPSPFYTRNFVAWQKVFADSRAWMA